MNLIDILKEGVTSINNNYDDILTLFSNLSFNESSEEIYSFYQGCGNDICTLLVDIIDNHVYSDNNSEGSDFPYNIIKKLEKLENNKFLRFKQKDEKKCSIIINNKIKNLYFTNEPLSNIDFKKKYGKLGLIFEFNPGSATRHKNFWDSASTNLIDNGYIIGSHSFDIKKSNRTAIVLKDNNGNIELYNNFVRLSDNENQKIIQYIENNKIQISNNIELINISDSDYLVSCINTNSKKFFITKVETENIINYNFYISKIQNYMILITKHFNGT